LSTCQQWSTQVIVARARNAPTRKAEIARDLSLEEGVGGDSHGAVRGETLTPSESEQSQRALT
jgi:hypothetical protein